MADVCVVHLVRAKNGLEPFRRFLDSYLGKSAGIEHDLLVVYKGFSSARGVEKYEKLLESYPHRIFFVKDFGFDIRPYLLVTKLFNYRYFCFFNSFSEILSDGWLEKMYRFCSRDDVGLVGATGSWQSLYNDAVNRKITRGRYPFLEYQMVKFCTLLKKLILRQYFPPFPNPHIRSNAFMIKREILLRVNAHPIFCKLDAWKFESGVNGLSRQVEAMNLKTIVVGRNGAGYDKECWPASQIYKQHDQSNLLVADNQTMQYALGDRRARARLSSLAWGDKSDVTACDNTLREP